MTMIVKHILIVKLMNIVKNKNERKSLEKYNINLRLQFATLNLYYISTLG